MKKALKKIIALVAVIAIIFPLSLCFTGCEETSEREYTLPSIDDDFQPGVLSVGLTAEYSGINKPIVKEDFTTKKMIWKEDVKGDMEKALKKYVVIDRIEDAFQIDDPSTVKNPKGFKQMLDVFLVNEDKQSVITAIKEFYKFSYVEWAEQWDNMEAVDDFAPNDECYYMQWGLMSEGGVSMDKVYNLLGANAGERVKVGIFESNIQTDHPDLTVVGANFIADSTASAEHGTLVAGIIGATTNNVAGIAGIAPVDIYLLNRARSSFADSLEWAYNNGCDIILWIHFMGLLSD